MRTVFITVLALIGGFFAGMVLSELIGIVGFLLLHRAVGIRFFPVIFALGCAGSALLIDLLILRRANRAPASPSGSRGRGPLSLVIGGAAVLALCTVLACGVIAGFQLSTFGPMDTDRAPAPDTIRSELASLPAGNANAGAQVFAGAGHCSTCHSLAPDVRNVGPSLSGVASRAATRRPGYSPEMYLYESIVDPDAFVVSGFQAHIMPGDFKQLLDNQQIADLVAFLATK